MVHYSGHSCVSGMRNIGDINEKITLQWEYTIGKIFLAYFSNLKDWVMRRKSVSLESDTCILSNTCSLQLSGYNRANAALRDI